MKISFLPYSLELKHQFTISHNSRKTTPVVFVAIEENNQIGYGEASLPPYLTETQESVITFLYKVGQINFDNTCLEKISEQFNRIDEGNYAAKAALNIALNDLMGKLENKSVRDLHRIVEGTLPFTSMTIGIDSEEMLKQKIKEADQFEILKIKLGSKNDKELINTIRKYTDKPLFVDANQGWKELPIALEMIDYLTDKNVLLIEQPMPKECLTEMMELKKYSSIPLIADESLQGFQDIDKCKDAFHGINIKLMKCGGIDEAIKLIERARSYNLKVMLGCMTESSCAISAAIQLASLVDYADLDGNILIKNDPFRTVTVKNGRLVYPGGVGLGVQLQTELEFISIK